MNTLLSSFSTFDPFFAKISPFSFFIDFSHPLAPSGCSHEELAAATE
jgi:hypothetical protein